MGVLPEAAGFAGACSQWRVPGSSPSRPPDLGSDPPRTRFRPLAETRGIGCARASPAATGSNAVRSRLALPARHCRSRVRAPADLLYLAPTHHEPGFGRWPKPAALAAHGPRLRRPARTRCVLAWPCLRATAARGFEPRPTSVLGSDPPRTRFRPLAETRGIGCARASPAATGSNAVRSRLALPARHCRSRVRAPSAPRKMPPFGGIFLAGLTGLEPATSGVTGRHSNRLSYNPRF